MTNLQLTHWVNRIGLQDKCAREGCRRTALRSSLLARRRGIRLSEAWFCGADCFREGVESQIRTLKQAPTRGREEHASRIPLGLLLVSRGCITSDQLRLARAQQQARGGALADILCELRFANERQVADAAATQWGCPVYSAKTMPSDIGAHIPALLMRLIAMAPVYYAPRANRLLIGFVHGIEHRVLRTIEHMTACLTEPCFITASECAEQIGSLTGRNTEVTFERVSSPAEMANIVQSYAFQIGADEARMALCHNHLWARLTREGHPTDLLFALAGENTPPANYFWTGISA